MTRHSATTIRANRDCVNARLATMARRQRRWAVAARAVAAVAAWAGLALAMVLADALWPMPGWMRLAVGLTLVGALATMLWRARDNGRDQQAAALAQARRIERGGKLPGNLVVNAALLSQAAGQPRITGALARRARAAGARAMRRHSVDVLAPERRNLRRAGHWLWAGAVGWVVVGLIQPGLLSGGAVRFLLPFGDQPWFSLTRISLSVSPPRPIFGNDAVVQATIFGQATTAAWLLTLDRHGRVTGRWPMRRRSPRRYARRLLALRRPIRLAVRSGSAQSRVLTVRPRAERARPNASAAARQTRRGRQARTRQGTTSGVSVTGRGKVNLARGLAQLRRQAQAIAAQAHRFAQASAANAAARKRLDAAVARFRARAGLMINGLVHAGVVGRVVAARLSSLGLMRAAESGGGKTQAHAGGKARSGDAWARTLARMARADAAALAQLAQVLGLAGHGTARGGQTLAKGVYNERVAPGGAELRRIAAMVDQAPPDYQAMVRAYFQRLARDSRGRGPAKGQGK